MPLGMLLMSGGLMTMSDERVPRDHKGNRLQWCRDCGAHVRADRFESPEATRCRGCIHRARMAAAGDLTGRGTRELSAEDLAELRERVEAARRLKAAKCGAAIEDGEIEAAIGGGDRPCG